MELRAYAERLMEIGKRANVPGIFGDCGGFMACATCHVYVEPEWCDRVGGPSSDEEREILAMTENVRPESRLGCQIWVTDELDGLRISPALAR